MQCSALCWCRSHAGATNTQPAAPHSTPPLVSSPYQRFPIIKLDRAEYLKTVRGFTFKQGIPNLSSNAYGFRWAANCKAGCCTRRVCEW